MSVTALSHEEAGEEEIIPSSADTWAVRMSLVEDRNLKIPGTNNWEKLLLGKELCKNNE